MSDTKKEKLEEVLDELKKTGGIVGSAIISRDGLTIATDLANNVDVDTFAAMTAAMQGAGETAISELEQGELSQIIIDAERGKIISIGVSESAILVTLTEEKINLGLILISIKKIKKKIIKILE